MFFFLFISFLFMVISKYHQPIRIINKQAAARFPFLFLLFSLIIYKHKAKVRSGQGNINMMFWKSFQNIKTIEAH